MLVAVLGVLDRFTTVWQAISAFGTARNDLSAVIDAVNAEELRQAGVTTGITQDKRLARRAMCQAAAVVGGAVAAWADRQGNHELFATVDFSASDLSHETEEPCVTHCQGIFAAGTANLAALVGEHTLAPADLDDLAAKIAAFNALLTKPREARAFTKGATNLLPEKLDAGDRLLERQLDRLMARYQATNADFYGAYRVARVIVEAGGGSATPPAPAQ